MPSRITSPKGTMSLGTSVRTPLINPGPANGCDQICAITQGFWSSPVPETTLRGSCILPKTPPTPSFIEVVLVRLASILAR